MNKTDGLTRLNIHYNNHIRKYTVVMIAKLLVSGGSKNLLRAFIPVYRM